VVVFDKSAADSCCPIGSPFVTTIGLLCHHCNLRSYYSSLVDVKPRADCADCGSVHSERYARFVPSMGMTFVDVVSGLWRTW
jgi:hypothetical protein